MEEATGEACGVIDIVGGGDGFESGGGGGLEGEVEIKEHDIQKNKKLLG